MDPSRTLIGAQVASFLNQGYLIVRDCIDLSIGKRWIREAYQRLGYGPG